MRILKSCTRNSVSRRSAYEIGVQKALILGYKPVEDERAFNGVYYAKNGKMWIFFLESLARKIGATCHNDFREHFYAIEDYLLYNHLSIEEMVITVFGKDSPEYEEHCHAFAAEDDYNGEDFDFGDDLATVMRDIYEMNGGDGSGDVYIGDGTWVSADGSYRCR
jgi:cytoplasmic protein